MVGCITVAAVPLPRTRTAVGMPLVHSLLFCVAFTAVQCNSMLRFGLCIALLADHVHYKFAGFAVFAVTPCRGAVCAAVTSAYCVTFEYAHRGVQMVWCHAYTAMLQCYAASSCGLHVLHGCLKSSCPVQHHAEH